MYLKIPVWWRATGCTMNIRCSCRGPGNDPVSASTCTTVELKISLRSTVSASGQRNEFIEGVDRTLQNEKGL